MRDTALSARDKAYLQTDLDDAEKSCARALETLSDPNATAKEQERALQSAIDETNWARYRLNEFDPFETQHEVNEAYDELTGILEKLERYKTEAEQGVCEPKAPLPDFAQVELPDAKESATIGGGSTVDVTDKLHGEAFVEKIVEDPKLFSTFDTPADFKAALEEAGFEVKPLGDGSLKGIPFESGGGYRINFSDGGVIMYHPATHSHHGEAYYKISTGKGGTHRYDRNGNEIIT